MSNTTAYTPASYTGNAVTVTFAFTFLAYASTELEVYVNNVLQTLNTHYSVTFASPPIVSGTPQAGSITFIATPAGQASGTAPASSVTVLIKRIAPLSQVFVPSNTAAFDAAGAGQTAWDELSFQVQQMNERINRAPVLKDSSIVALGDASLPDPVANAYLTWNGSGTALANTTGAPTAGTVIPLTPPSALLRVNAAGTGVETALLPILGTGGLVWFVGTTGGTSTAYTYAPSPFPVAYAQGMVGVMRFHTTNGAAPTLNLATIGAKNLQYYTAAGVATNVAANDLISGENYIIAYDATLDKFMVLGTMTQSAFNSWINATGNFIPQKNLPYVGVWSHIGGLGLSTAGSSTTLSIAKGAAMDSTNAQMITNPGTFTKLIAAAATWAVGTAANGNAANSVASTWYHVFILGKTTDPTAVDFGFDTSVTAANLLALAAVVTAGFNLFRRIGSVKTDGSKNITRFFQYGDYFRWQVQIEDLTSTALSNTAASVALPSVPLGIVTLADLNVAVTAGITAQVLDVYSTNMTDETVTNVGSVHAGPGLVGATGTQSNIIVPTDTSQQVRTRASGASGSFNIWTRGYFDYRGKDV